MPPQKSKNNKTPFRKMKSPKSENNVSRMKTGSKHPVVIPENNTDVEPVSSTSATSEPTCSFSAKENTSKYDSYLVTPKVIKSYLNAYKLSPDYDNLKKKRFNTSFRFEKPRGDRDIEIFTPEEEAQFLKENPINHNFHYGDKTANVFMSIPEINIDDVEEEIAAIKAKCKNKKGRKKSVGYKGVPFLDDGYTLTDYNTDLLTP